MSNLKNEFIEYLNEQVENHSIYVWGAQGQTGGEISEKWIREHESSEINGERAVALWKKQTTEGYGDVLRAFDCSGLVMFFLHELKAVVNCDLTAAGLMRLCDESKKNILEAGDLVFRDNGSKVHHVGVYVGDGKVIEAMGRDVGVVKRHIDDSGSGYWNRFGRLNSIFADEGAKKTASFAYPHGSVNIRTGAGKSFRICATAHSTDKLLAMSEVDGWREIAAIVNGEMIHGYMNAKYISEVKGVREN